MEKNCSAPRSASAKYLPSSERQKPETNLSATGLNTAHCQLSSQRKSSEIYKSASSSSSERYLYWGRTKPETNLSAQRLNYQLYSENNSSSESYKSESRSESARYLLSSQRKTPETNVSGFSPNNMEIFQAPMCLLSSAGEDILKIETKTAEQIAMIDCPIVVVAIVGLYRTGKSYLMNRLAASTVGGGFALGDTIEATTKGIWVWCKMHPEKSNTVLLLLDTEGLGCVAKGDPSHDNRIFILATLLCNCLVYNMKGAFDEDAVSKLTFVTEIARNIRFKGNSSDDNGNINLILPDFVLCLRDFSLKLSKGGEKITEDEYLEQSLEIQGNRDDKFNKPRECIRKYFPVRKCFTLPVPGDAEVLENLEAIPFDSLSDRFKDATNRFAAYIYRCKPKKLLASKPVNGKMFTSLINYYVTAIRNGKVPDVDDAFSVAAKIENSRVEKKALEMFEKQMGTVVLPAPSKVLETCYKRAQLTTLNYLRENVVHDKDAKFELQAQMKMDHFSDRKKEENTEKVRKLCQDKIEEVFDASMERNIQMHIYDVAGGYLLFKKDMNSLKQEYFKILKVQNFEEHEISWTWFGFLETIKKFEARIIEADEKMTKKEKADEKRRNEEQLACLKKEHESNQAAALRRQHASLQKLHNNLMEERNKKFAELKMDYQVLVDERLELQDREDELNEFKKQLEETANKTMEAERKRTQKEYEQKMEEMKREHASEIRKQQNALEAKYKKKKKGPCNIL